MPYIVKISVGKGKERAVTQSIPLPTKERVRRYVKRNPLGNYRTKVIIINTSKRKRYLMTKGEASRFGINMKKVFK
jgi:hypothetical protein